MTQKEPTLSEALAQRGYTHRKAQNTRLMYARDILNADGVVVFTGNSQMTWAWLHDAAA